MAIQTQTLFLSHGGGPLPLLGDLAHGEMVGCLKKLAVTISKPSAVVVMSAHWEERRTTITSGANPPLIYDYYGFPKESYEIKYPCQGDPRLASRIASQLERAGMDAHLDEERGFDHGLFVPLKIMYPDADIPCVQISLLKSLDPAEHLKVGEAMRDLDVQSLLFIGSGFSFHNMNAFFAPETGNSRTMNESFESWLLETLSSSQIDEEERTQRLVNWEAAPFARYCHPREEHLLPLHVCYGFAATACSKSFELQIFNKKSSMYLWQAES
jgi:aromatic ring-opening dioxygenase catalytic subunit (LigB family)